MFLIHQLVLVDIKVSLFDGEAFCCIFGGFIIDFFLVL